MWLVFGVQSRQTVTFGMMLVGRQFVLALRSTCPGPPREETRPDWVLWAYLGPLARALFLSLDLLAGRALMWDNLGGSLPSRRY